MAQRAGRGARRRGTRRREADAAWKGVLHALLPEFVAFANPPLHGAIDWSRKPEFLDKEVQAVARRAATGRRYVDLLAKVWRREEHFAEPRSPRRRVSRWRN